MLDFISSELDIEMCQSYNSPKLKEIGEMKRGGPVKRQNIDKS